MRSSLQDNFKRQVIKPLMKNIRNMSQWTTFYQFGVSAWRAALYLITFCALALVLWIIIPIKVEEVTLINTEDQMLQAVYKCAYENTDGSVDLVFNIPRGGEQLLRMNILSSNSSTLRLAKAQNAKAQRNDVGNRQDGAHKVPKNGTGHKVPPRPWVKTLYPLSLDADYVINAVSICPVGQQVDYVVVVHSATAYFDRRRAIRETYGGRKLFGNINQRIVFLLGTTTDPTTTEKIREEALLNRDIVQGRFTDSYHNLTHKGVLGYRWISEHCPQAKFVIKVDDDVFLNPFKLARDLLPAYYGKSRHIACHLRPIGTSPIVRGSGRWQVNEEEFKGQEHYPFDYCNGYFVIITSDLIRPMLKAARMNPFFWIDDVYLFGILPATVGQTTFVDIKANLSLTFNSGKDCYQQHGANCPLLAISQWMADQPERLWYMVLSNLTETVRKELNVFGVS